MMGEPSWRPAGSICRESIERRERDRDPGRPRVIAYIPGEAEIGSPVLVTGPPGTRVEFVPARERWGVVVVPRYGESD